MSPTEQRAALNELTELYERVDGECSIHRCKACGDCCHFKQAGHLLFVSELEKMFFANRHPDMPLFDGPPDVCPFLDGSLCTAREARSLACRTYFCSAPRESREATYEKYFREVKDISRRHSIPYSYTLLFVKTQEANVQRSGGWT